MLNKQETYEKVMGDLHSVDSILVLSELGGGVKIESPNIAHLCRDFWDPHYAHTPHCEAIAEMFLKWINSLYEGAATVKVMFKDGSVYEH